MYKDELRCNLTNYEGVFTGLTFKTLKFYLILIFKAL